MYVSPLDYAQGHVKGINAEVCDFVNVNTTATAARSDFDCRNSM